MALDRRSIERKDFPVERRGYSAPAVDAHLSALADEVDSLSAELERLRRLSPAAATAEQVRSILEAAESSAAEIQRSAEEHIRGAQEQADDETQAIRERAAHQARTQVGAVSSATEAMLERLRSMESKLGSLGEGCERLSGDLKQLEGSLSQVAGAIVAPSLPVGSTRPAAPGPEAPSVAGTESAAPVPEDSVPAPADSGPTPDDAGPTPNDSGPAPDDAGPAPNESGPAPDDAGPAPKDSGPAPKDPGPTPSDSEPAPTGSEPVREDSVRNGEDETRAGLSGDEADGARLIALNMALTGTPRGKTARYLQENFSLSNPDRLLDEVYASVDQ